MLLGKSAILESSLSLFLLRDLIDIVRQYAARDIYLVAHSAMWTLSEGRGRSFSTPPVWLNNSVRNYPITWVLVRNDGRLVFRRTEIDREDMSVLMEIPARADYETRRGFPVYSCTAEAYYCYALSPTGEVYHTNGYDIESRAGQVVAETPYRLYFFRAISDEIFLAIAAGRGGGCFVLVRAGKPASISILSHLRLPWSSISTYSEFEMFGDIIFLPSPWGMHVRNWRRPGWEVDWPIPDILQDSRPSVVFCPEYSRLYVLCWSPQFTNVIRVYDYSGLDLGQIPKLDRCFSVDPSIYSIRLSPKY